MGKRQVLRSVAAVGNCRSRLKCRIIKRYAGIASRRRLMCALSSGSLRLGSHFGLKMIWCSFCHAGSPEKQALLSNGERHSRESGSGSSSPQRVVAPHRRINSAA